MSWDLKVCARPRLRHRRIHQKQKQTGHLVSLFAVKKVLSGFVNDKVIERVNRIAFIKSAAVKARSPGICQIL